LTRIAALALDRRVQGEFCFANVLATEARVAPQLFSDPTVFFSIDVLIAGADPPHGS